MSSSSNLNSTGQACLAAVGSVVSNVVVHPLCTIKNKYMAGESLINPADGRFNKKGLYRGFSAICLTESAALIAVYVCNGWMKSYKIDKVYSAIIAGVFSAPVVSIGEYLMISSQVNKRVINSEMLRSSLKISGLLATALREVPYSLAVLVFSPWIGSHIKLFPSETADEAVGGLISGSLCGAITGPFDKTKTLVQANGMSFITAGGSVLNEFTTAQGRKNHIRAAGIRALYIGLATSILNVVNSRLPELFPKNMRE